MNRIIYFIIFILLSLSLSSIVAFVGREDDTQRKHKEITLRQIGHHILWHAGDSSSRVMPIQQTNNNTYQIHFSEPFAFIPDSVISIVNKTLADGNLTGHYFVEMKTCGDAKTVFAYEMDPSSGNLVPCEGRSVGSGCYFMEIRFVQDKKANWYWAMPAAILLLAIGGYLVYHKSRSKPILAAALEDNAPRIGQYKFDQTLQTLQWGEETIALNENETLALTIFTENLQQTVSRDQLMKQIWEDKGLIVIDRNVDVLVSKLRKKLQADPSIKILNVHGRGYKMIIEA